MNEELRISLNTNQAREKISRAVPFIGLGLLAAISAFCILRLVLTRDTLSSVWPENTVGAIRIIKTANNLKIADDQFSNIVISSKDTRTIYDVLNTSNREVIFFFNQEGELTAVSDTEKINQKKSWPRFSIPLIWPNFNGELLLKRGEEIKSSPINLKNTSLTLYGSFKSLNLTKTKFGESINFSAALSLDGALAKYWLPKNISLNTPGLQALIREAEINGLSVFTGEDDQGFFYWLGINNSLINQEELENIVRESLSLFNIELITPENQSYTEIRLSDINLNTSVNTDDSIIVTARDAAGNFSRGTATSHQTIITNRDIYLPVSKEAESGCFKKAREFISPSQLSPLITAKLTIPVSDLSYKLSTVKEIALAKNKMRICW